MIYLIIYFVCSIITIVIIALVRKYQGKKKALNKQIQLRLDYAKDLTFFSSINPLCGILDQMALEYDSFGYPIFRYKRMKEIKQQIKQLTKIVD